MTGALFTSILVTGFTVSFLHGALPTHWLPFVLVGRRQGWSAVRTVAVTALAGLGHVLMTMALGLVLVASGIALQDHWGKLLPLFAGGLLVALGLFYIARHALGAGGHTHNPLLRRFAPAYAGSGHGEAPALSDRTAILGLFAVLALSPCEAFLPIYVSGISYGWAGFGLLSAVLAGGAIASMTALTALSLTGAGWLGLKAAERYEALVLGAALCLLGVLVIVLER